MTCTLSAPCRWWSGPPSSLTDSLLEFPSWSPCFGPGLSSGCSSTWCREWPSQNMWRHATHPFRTWQSALLSLRIKGGVLAVATRLRHDWSPFFLVSSLTSSPNRLLLSSPGRLFTAFQLTESSASETLPQLPPQLVSSSSFPVGVTLRPGSQALLWEDSSQSVSRVSARLVLGAKAFTADSPWTVFSGRFCIAGSLGRQRPLPLGVDRFTVRDNKDQDSSETRCMQICIKSEHPNLGDALRNSSNCVIRQHLALSVSPCQN